MPPGHDVLHSYIQGPLGALSCYHDTLNPSRYEFKLTFVLFSTLLSVARGQATVTSKCEYYAK